MRPQGLFWPIMLLLGIGVALLMVTDGSGSVFGIPSGRFAGTLYMGVWALVLASAFLRSPFRRANAVRNALLWLLIIAMLMTLYRFRDDIAAFFGRSPQPSQPVTETMAFESILAKNIV